MLLYILGAIVLLVVILLIVASTKPDQFRIERNILINAPAEKIFQQLENFHHWRNWSPWEELDPKLQRDYSGPASGVGAIYGWQGNKKVGKGRMEIIESTAPQHLRIQLDFIEPFPANNIAEFSLQTLGDNIRINWTMDGKNIFMSKLMSVFINMDKLIGKDFEKGLNKLKQYCESTAS